ncbi:predicted protein [Histoplasma mississippiense (nom. inval.)]|uniref:predicted protein n=1 Tax=Ajellomyces capsulatus (strain NAm1 / WU24) TaxID=2059318 RepID=UPI000157C192|nr:predicted protein [Histoplasma mississippiense (nom. inval.)]EDN07352.1 predicted protein [Histoplasma mississippiense (nom. inval.)]
MEEEILRQIIDEGLLDGIDLQSLDPAQEDELSERIAEAYRRRHLRQPIPRHNVRGDGDNRSRDPRSRQSRSNSVDVRPPVTRSHLLEAPSQRTDPSNRQQRSSSDQGVRRRATSPTHRTAASSSDALIQPAVRSSSDLSGPRRPSQNNSTSESFRHRTASSLSSSRRSGEFERRTVIITKRNSRDAINGTFNMMSTRPAIDVMMAITICVYLAIEWAADAFTGLDLDTVPRPDLRRNIQQVVQMSQNRRTSYNHAAQNRPNSSRRRTKDDPAKRLQRGMFCDMCQSFSDDCFWTCSECNGGEWGFCNSCVNQGKCCTHALLPIGRVPQGDIVPGHPASSSPVVTSDYVSANTIKVGSDSYRPLTFSTKCNNCTYPIPPSTSRFHCPTCNDGDYDLCTNCYLKLGANGKISKGNGRNGWRRCLQGHRMIIVGFEDHPDGQRRAIVKDVVGGHALKDDVAVAVAAAAAATPTTSDNASTTPNSNGAVLIPVRRDSGDWTWKEESSGTTSITHRRRFPRTRTAWSNSSPTSLADPSANTPFSSHFPPSGGVGLRLLARWSYYPEPDVTDEIMFPCGAEITEADNINDDWMWGCYAGQKGLFPGSYVVVIGEVRLE